MKLPSSPDLSEAKQSPNPHYKVTPDGRLFDINGNEKSVSESGKAPVMVLGEFKPVSVGFLVLSTFTGPNPYEVSGGAVVWLDGDKSNNNIDNLVWKSCPTLESGDVYFRPEQDLIEEPSTEALQVEGFVEGVKPAASVEY